MSKPDITSHDTGSSGSSPSPCLGVGQLSESANGSVPVTPTWDTSYEFSSALDHQFMQNGSNRPTGRIMGSQSASVSRKPSMTQMHAPASVKIEPGYLDPVRGWGLPSQPESTHFPGRAVLEESSAGLSAILWRATGTPVAGSSFTQQNSLANDSMDNLDDPYWPSQVPSQAPSRLGSIDQSMNISFGYRSAYSSDVDLCIAPDMYSASASASASTASLTASLSEASHYGDNHQFYANQWADHGSVGNRCGGLESIRLEPEIFDSQASFTDDEHYIGGVDDTPFFPSPLQDTATTLPQ